eukprot:8943629-Pyramimonas_sp.AAC.1
MPYRLDGGVQGAEHVFGPALQHPLGMPPDIVRRCVCMTYVSRRRRSTSRCRRWATSLRPSQTKTRTSPSATPSSPTCCSPRWGETPRRSCARPSAD